MVFDTSSSLVIQHHGWQLQRALLEKEETMQMTAARPKAIFALAAVMLATALAASLSLGVGNAYAGGGSFDISLISAKKIGLSYNPKSIDWWNKYSFTTKKKLTNVKSSNPKVLTAKASGKKYMTLVTKKPGIAKLTYKLNGKKKTTTIVVKNYTNPLKTFKVGNQNCASQYKNRCDGYTSSLDKYENIIGKVTVKPNKNWKIKTMKAFCLGGFKTIKNKSKLPSETTTVQLIMQNTKTKVLQRIYLYAGDPYYTTSHTELRAAGSI